MIVGRGRPWCCELLKYLVMRRALDLLLDLEEGILLVGGRHHFARGCVVCVMR